MDEWMEVKVLYGALLEATVSIRQLHEDRRLLKEVRSESARTCGVEARSKPQHRAKSEVP